MYICHSLDDTFSGGFVGGLVGSIVGTIIEAIVLIVISFLIKRYYLNDNIYKDDNLGGTYIRILKHIHM